jgi:hypothetical protein
MLRYCTRAADESLAALPRVQQGGNRSRRARRLAAGRRRRRLRSSAGMFSPCSCWINADGRFSRAVALAGDGLGAVFAGAVLAAIAIAAIAAGDVAPIAAIAAAAAPWSLLRRLLRHRRYCGCCALAFSARALRAEPMSRSSPRIAKPAQAAPMMSSTTL